MTAAVYACELRHTRTTPVRHAFAYRTYPWLIDLDDPPRHRLLASFDPGLRSDVERFLAERGITPDGGRILLLTHPRVLGYVFNPLSVYWCHRADGTLAAVVADVHNTYGGRHRYLLHPDTQGTAETAKEFYVSPFFDVRGSYRLRLPLPGDRLDLGITLEQDGGRPFVATLRGRRTRLRPLRQALSTALIRVRITVQGLRLWRRGLPVVAR